jgi:TonB family protein
VRPILPFALACFAAGSAAVAQEVEEVAQEAAQPEASADVEVTPVSRVNPEYPSGPLAQGREGWVELSFVISETGDVIEPMIEQSSGGEPFERAALRAVQEWKYLPATEDGVPVERAVKTIIRFQLEGGGGGGQVRGEYVERASAAFVKNYRQLVRLVDGQDFEGAAALLATMEAEQRLSRYETAFLWWAKYVYLSRTSSSDLAQMRRALERAVGGEDDMYLSMDQFVAAAERLVVLHAQAADIAAAMATFERLRDTVAEFAEDRATAGLRAVPSYTQSVAALQPAYEAMQELVNSDRLMAMNGSVGEFDYWVHDLLRRSFSLADIQGRLDALDIRCERGRRRYDSIPVDTVWRVPEEWGTCGVYVKGESGTTFAFREYPRSYVHAASVDVSQRGAR